MALTQSQIDTATAEMRLASSLLSLRAYIEHCRIKHGHELYPSITAPESTFDADLLEVNHLSHLTGGELTNFKAALDELVTWGGDPNDPASNWYRLLSIVPSVPE